MKITVGSTLLLCRCEWTEMKRKAAEQLIDDCQLGWWIRYMAETAWPFLVRLPRSFPLFLSAWLAVCFAVDVLLQKLEQTILPLHEYAMQFKMSTWCSLTAVYFLLLSKSNGGRVHQQSPLLLLLSIYNKFNTRVYWQASINNRATACTTQQNIWK